MDHSSAIPLYLGGNANQQLIAQTRLELTQSPIFSLLFQSSDENDVDAVRLLGQPYLQQPGSIAA